MLAIYNSATGEVFPTDPRYAWIDPGLIAAVGAGSMLGGATRLAIASTVIVVRTRQMKAMKLSHNNYLRLCLGSLKYSSTVKLEIYLTLPVIYIF